MILNILIVLFILISFLIIKKFNLSLGVINNKYQKTKQIVIWYDKLESQQYYSSRRNYIYLFTIKN